MHELAASEFGRRQHGARDSLVAGRRRSRAEPVAVVGARCGDPQENTRRQSGAAVCVWIERHQSPTKNHRESPMRRLIEIALSLVLFVLALSAASVYGQARSPLAGAWKVTEIANPGSAPLTSPQPGLYVFTEKHYSAVRLNGAKP